MFKTKDLSVVFSFLLAASTVSIAQTTGWTIITSSKDTLRFCTVENVHSDTASLMCDKLVTEIPLDSLSIVIKHTESHFWRTAGYGTIIGVGVGAIVGAASYSTPTGRYAIDVGQGNAAVAGGILGAGAGFVVGGILGATSGGDEQVTLAGMSTEERTKTLRDILQTSR